MKNNKTTDAKDERFCKSVSCGKFHSIKEVERTLGKESSPALLGYCSVRCYTTSFISLGKPTNQEIFDADEIKRLKSPFGRIDNYLMESNKYTQEDRELIMEFLFGGTILGALGLEIITKKY